MFCRSCVLENKANLAGQGFTNFKCEKCGQTGFWHNTNVPKYCLACSDKNLICGYCGKDMVIEMVNILSCKMNLYEIALEVGISESSLRKYVNTGSIGPRVYTKLKEFTEEFFEGKGGF